MHPTSRFGSKTAALVAALLLAGTAGAQEARPAAPAAVPQVQKLTIYNGLVPTVNYSVEGGSPHLQALVQTMQFTENELNLTGELQKLRLEIVANEQTLDRVRTSQALGLGPISTPGYAARYAQHHSDLKSALIPGLAREATPAMAYELINLREQVQTELQAEQNKAAASVRGKPPARQNAQPAAPVAGPVAAAQAVPQQPPMPPVWFSVPAAPQRLPMPLGKNEETQPVQVFWGNSWWPAEIKEKESGLYRIHYTGWDASWDQWVTRDKILFGNDKGEVRGEPPARENARPVAPVAGPVAVPQAVAQPLPTALVRFSAPAALQPLPMPLNPQQLVAFQQRMRQQFMQVQQQLMQTRQ